MPTLRELLNPQTADAQLAANPPAQSGLTTGQVASEVSRYPGINADAAIGNLAGRAPASPTPPAPTMDRGYSGGMSESEARKMWAANGNDATGWNKNPDGTWSAPGSVKAGESGSSSYIDRINNAFGQFKPKSESDIIREETSAIQDQINAINNVFDSRVSAATKANEGRSGSTRALNATAGTVFDPMGAAAADATTVANQQIIDSINNDRLAEISNLMAAARGSATKRIESQTDRFIGLANDQVTALANAYNLSADEENNLRNAVLARAKLTGSLDGDPTMELRQMLADEAQRKTSNDLATRELDAKIREAEASGKKVIQGDNGSVMVYDPYTGKTTNLGNYGKGTGTGSGNFSQDSFYDLIISDLASGNTDYGTIITDYGSDVAKAVDTRIRELRRNGKDPFAPAGSPSSAPSVPDRIVDSPSAPVGRTPVAPSNPSTPSLRIGANGKPELYYPERKSNVSDYITTIR